MASSTGSRSRLPVFAATAVALALAAAPAAADVQIGAAAQVVNSVTGTLAATRQAQLLRAGIDVFQNETIDTANASASRVVFQDQTQLSIGPASKVVLDRFVFDPNPSSSVVAVSIAKGVARFSTGLLPKPDYQIATPSCTIGVRGTVFTTIVSETRDTWVAVEEGTTVVSAQGVTVTVNAGQTTFVAFGRPPTPPSPSPPPPAITTQMDALLGVPRGVAPYGLPDSGYPPGGGSLPGGYYPTGGDSGSHAASGGNTGSTGNTGNTGSTGSTGTIGTTRGGGTSGGGVNSGFNGNNGSGFGGSGGSGGIGGSGGRGR